MAWCGLMVVVDGPYLRYGNQAAAISLGPLCQQAVCQGWCAL